MSNRFSCYLFAAVLLLCASFARASNTTLTGTITDAQGNPLNGTLQMRLPVPAQDTTLLTAVSNSPVTFNLVNGMIVGGAPLKDVATLQPQGLYYIARAYDYTGALQFSGNYVVTGTTFNLGAAIPTAVTTSNISYILPILPTQTNSFTAAQQFTVINSASTPSALSGFIRRASTDSDCWRNSSNSADVCIGQTNLNSLDWITVGSTLLANGVGSVISGPLNGTMTLTTFVGTGPGASIFISPGNAASSGQNGGNLILTPGLRNGAASNGTVQVNHGMSGGSGFQRARQNSCTTGAGAGASCNTTVFWPVTFDDTDYTAACNVSGETGGVTGTPSVMNTSSKTTTSILVTIINNSAVASSGVIDCLGVHD